MATPEEVTLAAQVAQEYLYAIDFLTVTEHLDGLDPDYADADPEVVFNLIADAKVTIY